jgi:hypothetical protein
MSDIPSINIGNITGGQNNIGKTEIAGDQNQINNYGSVEPTVEEVLNQVEQALPEEPIEIGGETFSRASIMPEMRQFAALPAEEQKSPDNESRMMRWLRVINEYRPAVVRNLAVFGAGALEAFAAGNPLVGGVLAVCKANSEDTSNSWEVHGRGQYDSRDSNDGWGEELTR